MNKCATLCCFLILGVNVIAQTSFQRHFGQILSSFDELATVARTADGQYLAAGTTANYGAAGYDMLFEKVDGNGNKLWQTTWGTSGNDRTIDAIGVSSGGFLVCGQTETVAGDNDLVVLRLDEEGNESWAITLGGPYDDEALFALELSDGGFIIAGHIVLEEENGQDIFLMRINTQGGVVWEKAVASPGNASLKGLAPATDGGFFVAEGQNLLTKFDEQGNEDWLQLILTPAGFPFQIEDLQRSSDGQLRISGQDQGTGGPLLGELDENGDLSSLFELSGFSIPSVALSFELNSTGSLWVLTRPFSGLSPVDPFISLFDPSLGVFTLSRTPVDLGLDDLATSAVTPYEVYTTDTDGFLFVGNTFSQAEGNNGLLLQADAAAEVDWSAVFGVEGPTDSESARMVIETTDGGYLLAGVKYDLVSGDDLWLIRTNAGGAIEWTSQLGNLGDDAVAGLAEMSDGSFALTGYRNDTLLVARIGSNGLQLWYREFAPLLADGTFGVTVSPEDDILITMPVATVGFSAGKLIKVNAQGDSLWTQLYQPSPAAQGFNATYGVTPADGGGFYLCGCAENEDGRLVPILLKTDEDGQEIWANFYEPIGGFSCLITMQQGTDSDLYANGISIAGGTHPYVLKASSEGVVERFDTLFTPMGTTYFSWFSDLQESTDYQALFGRKSIRYSFQPGSFNAGAISLLDTDGTTIWERDFGQDIGGGFLGGVATSDGGFAAVGSALFDNSRDAWLVKTEADGTVGFATLLAAPFEVEVSPNPANDWLRVSVGGLQEETVRFSIYDLNGQNLRTDQRPAVGGTIEHTFSVSSLPSGLYLLHLQQGGRSMTVKWAKQ